MEFIEWVDTEIVEILSFPEPDVNYKGARDYCKCMAKKPVQFVAYTLAAESPTGSNHMNRQ